MRCPWPGEDPFYVAYHDTEWGVPEYDDRALYEKLILDGFQAGLSWITILRKRDNFRKAFDDFQPEKIARYNAKKVHALMNDAGIVRNRAKIEGAIDSAKAYLKIMEEGPGFSKFLWDFVDGRPKVNQFKTTASVPASTPLSIKISKELGARGFKFVGPTIVYAFMQATGMVNDHLVTCFCHETCGGQPRKPAPQSRNDQARPLDSLPPAPGSGCCRDGGSICSTPRRSTSRSPISPTGWRGSRAGTGRPAARIFSRSRSTRCWSRPCCASRCRASTCKFRLAALLHDAPEYVIGDMISPFKAVIGGDYKVVEKRLLSAIHIRFGLPPVLADEIMRQIKAADRGAAYLEATHLAGFSEAEAKRLFGSDPGLPEATERDYLTPWTAAQGREAVSGAIQGGARRRTRAGVRRHTSFAVPDLHARAAAYNRAQSRNRSGNPMIHVCSLAALPDTVKATGASHILTVMANVDQVQRPASVLRSQSSQSVDGRHHRAAWTASSRRRMRISSRC